MSPERTTGAMKPEAEEAWRPLGEETKSRAARIPRTQAATAIRSARYIAKTATEWNKNRDAAIGYR